MTQLFLKAKHWQLFTLMLGIPMIYQIFFMTKILGIQNHQESITGEEEFTEVLNEKFIQFDHFDFFPYLMIFFSLIFFGWFWSIAIGLQKNIPKQIKMKVNKSQL